MSKNVEQINNSDGIVEVKYGDEIYKTWKVKFIRPLITNFLKEKYYDSLIIPEINKIDITIFDNITNIQIPVEIQKIPIGSNKFANTSFEQAIRKQLEDNIENYGMCWFFFDSEYLKYLQSGNVGKTVSIDLTWLVKLMKEKTIKVFTIKYDGIVKELTTKDFDFLKNISQLCAIGYDNDDRILNRNKLKIYHNVVYGYKFTQNELDGFYKEFYNRKNNEHNKKIDSKNFFILNNNKRCKLYGNILYAIGNLSAINNTLLCTSEEHKKHKQTIYLTILGLLYQNNFVGNSNLAQIQFIDKFNVAQYFPGYLRNKEMWDYCKLKQRSFSINDFSGITNGTFNYEFIKKQSIMSDY